jgi:hypothetical protein
MMKKIVYLPLILSVREFFCVFSPENFSGAEPGVCKLNYVSEITTIR